MQASVSFNEVGPLITIQQGDRILSLQVSDGDVRAMGDNGLPAVSLDLALGLEASLALRWLVTGEGPT